MNVYWYLTTTKLKKIGDRVRWPGFKFSLWPSEDGRMATGCNTQNLAPGFVYIHIHTTHTLTPTPITHHAHSLTHSHHTPHILSLTPSNHTLHYTLSPTPITHHPLSHTHSHHTPHTLSPTPITVITHTTPSHHTPHTFSHTLTSHTALHT